MKNMNVSDLKNVNFKKLLKPLEKIGKQHYFIISMLLILVLAGIIYTVSTKINTIEDTTEDVPATSLIQFDQQTIKELNKIGDGNSNYSPPKDKRLSPFAE